MDMGRYEKMEFVSKRTDGFMNRNMDRFLITKFSIMCAKTRNA